MLNKRLDISNLQGYVGGIVVYLLEHKRGSIGSPLEQFRVVAYLSELHH
jgi:hypothetical protein